MSSEELSREPIEVLVPEGEGGVRLDAFLAKQFPQYSRVMLRRVITASGVQVDGRGAKPAYLIRPGERISIALPDLPRRVRCPKTFRST